MVWVLPGRSFYESHPSKGPSPINAWRLQKYHAKWMVLGGSSQLAKWFSLPPVISHETAIRKEKNTILTGLTNHGKLTTD